MSCWELVRQQYLIKYELTEPKIQHLLYMTKDSFATNIKGKWILFAKFRNEAIYSREVEHKWKFEEDREIVKEAHFKATFINYRLVDNLDYLIGTAKF
jgi:hypothetical protein